MSTITNELQIPAPDGFNLAATLYQPATQANDAMIIIHSATAVPRHFYKHFATFLTEQGYTVLTYDYRGIGGSRPATLKGFQARMRDWGERDMTGVIDWVTEQYAPPKLFHIGHSFGGQFAGLLPNHHKIDAMLTISAQSGYWGLQPGFEKYRVWFFVTIIFPLLTKAVGYLPWSRMGSGEDLPKGVALEWAKWCRFPRYLLDDKTLTTTHRFAHFQAPILAYSFTDDAWGSQRSVDNMMSNYTGAPVERRHVAPDQVGMSSIGHMGFFRPQAKQLWQETAVWLQQHRHQHSIKKAIT